MKYLIYITITVALNRLNQLNTTIPFANGTTNYANITYNYDSTKFAIPVLEAYSQYFTASELLYATVLDSTFSPTYRVDSLIEDTVTRTKRNFQVISIIGKPYRLWSPAQKDSVQAMYYYLYGLLDRNGKGIKFW